jgi:hypothetical protein
LHSGYPECSPVSSSGCSSGSHPSSRIVIAIRSRHWTSGYIVLVDSFTLSLWLFSSFNDCLPDGQAASRPPFMLRMACLLLSVSSQDPDSSGGAADGQAAGCGCGLVAGRQHTPARALRAHAGRHRRQGHRNGGHSQMGNACTKARVQYVHRFFVCTLSTQQFTMLAYMLQEPTRNLHSKLVEPCLRPTSCALRAGCHSH